MTQRGNSRDSGGQCVRRQVFAGKRQFFTAHVSEWDLVAEGDSVDIRLALFKTATLIQTVCRLARRT